MAITIRLLTGGAWIDDSAKSHFNAPSWGAYMFSFLIVFNCKFNDSAFSQQYNAGRTNGRGETDEGNDAPGQNVQEGQEDPGSGKAESLDHESGHAHPGIRESL